MKSQSRQLVLFRNIIPLSKILADILSSPLEYYRHRGVARPPWAINFLVTSKCNLNCEMCSFKASEFCSEELSLDEIKEFIKHESRRKFHIFLGGGEPFLREDILEIIETIKRFGLTCGICTNGTLLDEIKIKKLLKMRMEYIIFSLYGPKDVHDKITRVAGSFESLLENMRILSSLKNKMKVIVNCTVTKSNLGHLKDVAEITKNLRADVLRFEHLNFLTDSEVKRHLKACQEEFPGQRMALSSYFGTVEGYSEYYNSVMQMQMIKDKYKIPIYFKPFLRKSELKSWYSGEFKVNRRCLFVWRSLFITPSGDIIPCQFLIYKLGNIKTDSLEDVWNSERYKQLRLRLKRNLFPGCARCCKL